MLEVVAEAANDRARRMSPHAVVMPKVCHLEDSEFDVVISRYSAHHWHDVGRALPEVNRVPEARWCIDCDGCDVAGHPVRDIWLQTVEALRDTSHVRNYSSGESGCR